MKNTVVALNRSKTFRDWLQAYHKEFISRFKYIFIPLRSRDEYESEYDDIDIPFQSRLLTYDTFLYYIKRTEGVDSDLFTPELILILYLDYDARRDFRKEYIDNNEIVTAFSYDDIDLDFDKLKELDAFMQDIVNQFQDRFANMYLQLVYSLLEYPYICSNKKVDTAGYNFICRGPLVYALVDFLHEASNSTSDMYSFISKSDDIPLKALQFGIGLLNDNYHREDDDAPQIDYKTFSLSLHNLSALIENLIDSLDDTNQVLGKLPDVPVKFTLNAKKRFIKFFVELDPLGEVMFDFYSDDYTSTQSEPILDACFQTQLTPDGRLKNQFK